MATVRAMDEAELRRQIVAIQTDVALSEAEKAQKRQALLSRRWQPADDLAEAPKGSQADCKDGNEPASTIFDESLKCTMCMELCNRPVTAPCQHNFCLGCFTKWCNQGKKTCPTCRHPFPAKFASNPRINTALASAIRMAKQGVRRPDASKAYVRIDDKDRPEEAFTTERAVRAGRANAASGRIMVTIPSDWFGPIPAEHDPIRGLGVQVGEFWKDRLDCRQWGAHFPHVAGIAGQGSAGAQSVVISGGYEDDQDEGEWFLYTGSGGRDLSGNKRVTNVQSFDQTFDRYNQALQISCLKGLPVRVIRSCKEKRSAYAPPEAEPVRYDGIYRVVRAYRKPGNQGKLVCRYLFIRCDNAPAPWSSEEQGDGPWNGTLPSQAQAEVEQADEGEVYEMASMPWWDFNPETKQWGWSREPPVSTKQGGSGTAEGRPARRKATDHERALKEFNCKLCSSVLNQPLSTPCGHHFCKPCLERVFQGVGDIENRTQTAGRALRERKIVKPCPTCKADIADFLATAQINRGMIDAIRKLQEAIKAAAAENATGIVPLEGAATAETEAIVEAVAEAVVREDGATRPGSQAPPASQTSAEEAPGPSREDVAAARLDKGRKAAGELEALKAEFPDFDVALLEGLLDDQGGDIEEVRIYLKRMVSQTAAAERKAKREAAKAAQGAEAGASQSSQNPRARQQGPREAEKIVEADEQEKTDGAKQRRGSQAIMQAAQDMPTEAPPQKLKGRKPASAAAKAASQPREAAAAHGRAILSDETAEAAAPAPEPKRRSRKPAVGDAENAANERAAGQAGEAELKPAVEVEETEPAKKPAARRQGSVAQQDETAMHAEPESKAEVSMRTLKRKGTASTAGAARKRRRPTR